MSQKYRHLFFDLDNTLWDFDTNCRNVLSEMFQTNQLSSVYQSFDNFYNIFISNFYRLNNDHLIGIKTWNQSDLAVADAFNFEFQNKLASQTVLLPFAFETIRYLSSRYYIYIITNGTFRIQSKKLESSLLKPFITKIYSSDQIGSKKPEKAFFEYAVKSSNAKKSECLVIGENMELDIIGAQKYGLDTIYFNPHHLEVQNKDIIQINELKELVNRL